MVRPFSVGTFDLNPKINVIPGEVLVVPELPHLNVHIGMNLPKLLEPGQKPLDTQSGNHTDSDRARLQGISETLKSRFQRQDGALYQFAEFDTPLGQHHTR
jgi:hypothetical protein